MRGRKSRGMAPLTSLERRQQQQQVVVETSRRGDTVNRSSQCFRHNRETRIQYRTLVQVVIRRHNEIFFSLRWVQKHIPSNVSTISFAVLLKLICCDQDGISER